MSYFGEKFVKLLRFSLLDEGQDPSYENQLQMSMQSFKTESVLAAFVQCKNNTCLWSPFFSMSHWLSYQISSDHSGTVWQATPDSISIPDSTHTPSCDSGFVNSITQRLSVQCLDCILEESTVSVQEDGTVKCCCPSKVHDGFEEYMHDIYMHRLQLESKYHVPSCLDNQPEVWNNR